MKKVILWVLILVLCITFAGCSTESKIEKIHSELEENVSFKERTATNAYSMKNKSTEYEIVSNYAKIDFLEAKAELKIFELLCTCYEGFKEATTNIDKAKEYIKEFEEMINNYQGEPMTDIVYDLQFVKDLGLLEELEKSGLLDIGH